jgi:hypothetical protein
MSAPSSDDQESYDAFLAELDAALDTAALERTSGLVAGGAVERTSAPVPAVDRPAVPTLRTNAPARTDKPLITVSSMKKWQSCNEAHHFRYVLGYKPVASKPALRMGTAWHNALETYWSTRQNFESV